MAEVTNWHLQRTVAAVLSLDAAKDFFKLTWIFVLGEQRAEGRKLEFNGGKKCVGHSRFMLTGEG